MFVNRNFNLCQYRLKLHRCLFNFNQRMTWLFVILFIFGFIVLIYAILTFADRNKIYMQWNECITNQCNYQNETDRAFRNIHSLQSAWVCQNEYVREMHRSIFLLHNELLDKVEEYFKTMIECAENGSSYQKSGGTRYFPFMINREITSLVETFGLGNLKTPAFNFGLLILEPGTTTQWRKEVSRGTYRYHYALKLPEEGEFGLYLRGRRQTSKDEESLKKNNSEEKPPIHRLKWKEKKGFIWDASIEHYLANQSSEPCFLLIADVPRHLSWKHHWINTLLHTYFPPPSTEISNDL